MNSHSPSQSQMKFGDEARPGNRSFAPDGTADALAGAPADAPADASADAPADAPAGVDDSGTLTTHPLPPEVEAATTVGEFLRAVGNLPPTTNEGLPPIRIDAHDLVGCRFRLRRKVEYPTLEPTAASLARQQRHIAQNERIAALLPTRPSIGDNKTFSRVRCEDEFDTLEALAAGHTLIENAHVSVSPGSVVPHGLSQQHPHEHAADTPGQHVHPERSVPADDSAHSGVSAEPIAAVIDLLVQVPGGYMPVIYSSHRVARPVTTGGDKAPSTRYIATSRLGLGRPVEGKFALRHHVADGYRLAVAAQFLAQVGLDTGVGGQIGQDEQRCFLVDTAGLVETFLRVYSHPLPHLPRRTKECRTCRFNVVCEPELIRRDDISLYLPGESAARYRQAGIDTVQGLIDSDFFPDNRLAAAWRDRVPLLVAPGATPTCPRRDIEIDIDMEAYLDHGAYLWGAFDGENYTAFATFGQVDGQSIAREADNFARFWDWLSGHIDAARRAGKTIGVYCYSNHGENHWLTSSARRFQGHVTPEGIASPDPLTIRRFIHSDMWIDVFHSVRNSVVSPFGLGLKDVASATGFVFSETDLAGEGSVDAYLDAVDDPQLAARIVHYNEEDVRATAHVRRWLSAGAPGIPRL